MRYPRPMSFQNMIDDKRVITHFRPLCAHPAWIEIDTAQFQKNLAAIRKMIGGRLFCLPVKANAYGHGLCRMAKIAEQSGVDSLGVSCLKEAVELRLQGISIPIVIFGGDPRRPDRRFDRIRHRVFNQLEI